MASIFASFDAPTTYAELGAVPVSPASITTDTFRLLQIFLSNVSTVDRTVTVTNTAGTALIQDMPLPANTPATLLQFGMMKVVGLKWSADGSGVNGQVEGFPNA